jgi:hypothetical protein
MLSGGLIDSDTNNDLSSDNDDCDYDSRFDVNDIYIVDKSEQRKQKNDLELYKDLERYKDILDEYSKINTIDEDIAFDMINYVSGYFSYKMTNEDKDNKNTMIEIIISECDVLANSITTKINKYNEYLQIFESIEMSEGKKKSGGKDKGNNEMGSRTFYIHP